jgi:hypothetical protein
MSERCKTCGGEGWVCENHRDTPWTGTSVSKNACGCGAGAPCGSCNLEMASACHARDARQPLLAVLDKLFGGADRMDEKVGWKGYNPSHPDLFKCEFCGVENLDCTQIEHSANCVIPEGRAAIARARGAA